VQIPLQLYQKADKTADAPGTTNFKGDGIEAELGRLAITAKSSKLAISCT
jgi:hypothetical protein